jgi:protein-tyrosine sulfotransferase
MSMQLQSPIFILGCHKSGTSLVRSLLDGHPEIDFVYPNELHYFRVAGYETRYPLGIRFPAPRDFADLARNALALIEPAAKGTTAFAPFAPHSTLDTFRSDLFLSTMLREPLPTDSRSRLLRYLDAGAVALGYDLGQCRQPVRLVEKSVSNIEFAPVLKQFFPDCHLIHVIRNPYANVVAIRRSKRGPDSIGALRPFVQALRLSFDHAIKNLQSIPDFHVLRYEDLVQDPERMARDICSRLGVGFAPSMLVPTVLGRPWGGNSSSRADFGSAVSQQPLREWESKISDIEVALVNRHLSDVMATLGYGARRSGQRWLLPATNEGARAYLANRLCLAVGHARDP